MDEIQLVIERGYAGDPTALRTLQLLCRFSLEDAARFCLVSPETFRRWRCDRTPNATAVRLLAIRAGWLPWPEWDGWQMRAGRLYPPQWIGQGLTPGEVAALPYLHQLLAEQRRALDAYSGQGVPARLRA